MNATCRIELGRVLRPVGLRGELKLLPAADFWPAALLSRHLRLEGAGGAEPVRVTESRPAGPCLVLRLAEVADHDAAEANRDALLVLEGEMDVPPPDEVRPFQVMGLRVVTAAGEDLGEVTGLEAMPAQPLLHVRGGAKDYAIPWVAPILQGVDWETGVITVDPPAGLLDL
jgi:16S rRNA processing protein RimM